MLLLVLLIVSLILLCYYYLLLNFNYWGKRGVPYPKPNIIFGNTMDVTFLKTTVGEKLQEIYKQYEGYPYVGIYQLRKPALLLRDPNLIKYVLVKDFSYFQGRGITFDEATDPLSANLINLSGPRWRAIRTKITPVFTAVKIRNMFGIIADCAKKFQDFAKKYVDEEEAVEFRNLGAKFTTEVISCCCFGLETNTIQNEDSEFRMMCRRILDPSLTMAVKRLIRMYLPTVYAALGMSLNPKDVQLYFLNIVGNMLRHREKNNIIRHDFLQLLMQMKHCGDMCEEENHKIEVNNNDNYITTNIPRSIDVVIDEKAIAAQAYIFFLAGFETSSTTMSFTMLELASNSNVQDKLYEEIHTTLEKYGTFSYDAISEMEYLDRVIRETLRKHPPVGMVPRLCNKSYTIPGTNVTIEKGIQILIPIHAIHHDSTYYPDPEKFDPDRFLDYNKKIREPFTFLPFGEGPRVCIGTRFAYTQVKAGIVALLKNYEVLLSSKTKIPIEYDPTANILTTKSGIWLELRHRKTKIL